MSKPAYERPILIRHEMGIMNKFSRVQAMRPLGAIDGASVSDLVQRYGSPLFVFSEKTIEARYRELHDAFSLRHPKIRIAWSYKTNYLDAICRTFHRLGAWAEVVSEFEYDKAIRNGVPAERIHFNGPFKPEPALEKAIDGGSLIHIDHFDELRAAEKIAERRGIKPGVAIRLNLAVDAAPHWSRFGFNLESGQALDAATRLLSGGHLDLIGLHCHLGTFILDTDAYKQQVEKLSHFANTLRERFGVILDFIDIGGGFASANTLKAQYLPGEQATPSFARYAEAVEEGLRALDYPPQSRPTLVLETGRALVDDAGSLIATVLANKRLPDGRRALVVDAGVNSLFTSFWYRHDVVPAQPFSGTPEPTVIYGPLCMNIDVMRDTMLFPPMEVGDRLVLRNTGAYNVTQWMQFITYRPAVVMVRADGSHALIREREDLETVVGPERVPPWLT